MARVSEQEIRALLNMPPRRAVEFFQGKDTRSSFDWWEIWGDANARSFTVAKATRVDVLNSLRDGVNRAIRDGISERQFIRELEPNLRRMGWWGQVTAVSESGVAKRVQLGSHHRLRTIFRTNTAQAYNVGRFEGQIAATRIRPFWMYQQVQRESRREAHAILNRRVWRHDDPIWQRIYPPNGFNCGCTVRALSEAQVRQRKLEPENSGGLLGSKTVDVGVDQTTGEVIQRRVTTIRHRDPATGKVRRVPIDPGFDFNPALARGDAGLGTKTRKLLGPQGTDDFLRQQVMAAPALAAFGSWVDRVLTDGVTRGRIATVGYLAEPDAAFARSQGAKLGNGEVVLEDRLLVGKKAERVERIGRGLTSPEWKLLPRVIAEPEVVLWDRQNKTLLYLFPADDQRIRIAVRPGFQLKSIDGEVESIRSAQRVALQAIEAQIRGGELVNVRGSLR